MPRFVLLEFDDNDEAHQFVAKTLKKSRKGTKVYIRGLFAKPTKYCQCGHLSELQQRQQVRRGKKFGWMVHTRCGLPRKHTSCSPRNLLDPINTPAMQTSAFLTLMGDWAGKKRRHTPLQNYPISVRTTE